MVKQEIKFEEAMAQLETIAGELEKGELDLETSLTKFEEGMKLSKICSELLDKAEKKITILLQEEGDLIEENFIQEE